MGDYKLESKYPFRWVTCYIANRYTCLKDWQLTQREAAKRFMNGHLTEKDMEYILDAIKNTIAKYGRPWDEWVITFIPASTNIRYEKRYFPLKEYLRKHLNIPVAYFGICIKEKSEKSFKGENEIIVTDNLFIKRHLINIKEKKVILIDDNVTTGRTLRTVGDFVMDKGAKAVYGVTYSMTIHPNLPIQEEYGGNRIRDANV